MFTKLMHPELIKFNPIFITAIILPLQFLVFNKIFKEPHYEHDEITQVEVKGKI
jgi:hypothetical protein